MTRLPLPPRDKKGQRAANSVGYQETLPLRQVHLHEIHSQFASFALASMMPRFKSYMYVPQPFQKKNKKKGGTEKTEPINRFQVLIFAPWVQHSALGNHRSIHYHMWSQICCFFKRFHWLISFPNSALRDDFQNIGRCHVGMRSGSIHSVTTDPNGLDSPIVCMRSIRYARTG